MIANVGMEFAVAAKISSYTPGSAPTYSTGFVVCESRGADLQWEDETGEFFGDNVRLDSTKEIVGYTLDFETTGLSETVRGNLLGDKAVGTGENISHKITAEPAPDVGFGWVTKVRDNTGTGVVTKYWARWFYKMKFGQPNESAKTKERTLEWTTPTISGVGDGIFQASDQEYPDFEEYKSFATKALAISWLKTKAGSMT